MSRRKSADASEGLFAAPGAPPVIYQKAVIDSILAGITSISEAGHNTEFLKDVARHQDFFRRCVFLFQVDNEGNAYLLDQLSDLKIETEVHQLSPRNEAYQSTGGLPHHQSTIFEQQRGKL